MKDKTLAIIAFFLLVTPSFAQHPTGTYTIDSLNQRDSLGRKQGYWEVYVDSNFVETDSFHHDFCYLAYFYNNRSWQFGYKLIKWRYDVEYELRVDIIDGKKMINGKVRSLTRHPGYNGGMNYELIIRDHRVITKEIYSDSKYYSETERFDKRMEGNDASCYLDGIYYGTKIQKGFIEMIGKKVEGHLSKTKVKRAEGSIIYNRDYKKK